MELLERVEKDIKKRLDELRPAVEESKRLEDALRQLGSQAKATTPGRRRGRPPGSSTRSTPATRTPRSTAGRRRRGRRTRVSGERRREQLVTLARENPDIKAREIADQLGTTPNNIYNLIRRLESEGTIQRRDGRLIVK